MRAAGMLVCYSATAFRSGYIEISERNKIEDCRADTDPAMHDFLCARIFPRQAVVVQAADVIKAMAA
jgi:hypothetical protein